jgi:hypothetical protein
MSCKYFDALCDATPAGPIDYPRDAFTPTAPLDLNYAVNVLERLLQTKTVTHGGRTWLEANA